MDRTQDQLDAKAIDYGEQGEGGIDLSLIRANLRLTPTDRVRRGDQARKDALRLSMAGETAKSALERIAEILLEHDVRFIRGRRSGGVAPRESSRHV